jgi:hypothetical protein
MSKFDIKGMRAQAAKGVEASEETTKPTDQKTRKPAKAKQEKYTVEDRKLVNVGGFKVPQVVRQHWKAQSAVKGQAIAPMLTDCLIEAFGLPQGMTREQFEELVTEGRKLPAA